MKRILALAFPAILVMPSLAPAQTIYYSRGSAASYAGRLERDDYQGYLRREPERGVANPTQPDLGHTPQYILSDVLSSDEYYAAAGGNRVDYVRKLYADVIGREPLPAEINYWAGRLDFDSRKDVTSQLVRNHPRTSFLISSPPPPVDPGYFPDPVSPTFCDPGGPYFHSPYFYNYENSRSIRAFPLSSQG